VIHWKNFLNVLVTTQYFQNAVVPSKNKVSLRMRILSVANCSRILLVLLTLRVMKKKREKGWNFLFRGKF